jgi:hypothetical protein
MDLLSVVPPNATGSIHNAPDSSTNQVHRAGNKHLPVLEVAS